jgi:hypothetical protein
MANLVQSSVLLLVDILKLVRAEFVPALGHCRQNIIATINGVFFSLLFFLSSLFLSHPVTFLRWGCPRVSEIINIVLTHKINKILGD